jgi:hypothetical protein
MANGAGAINQIHVFLHQSPHRLVGCPLVLSFNLIISPDVQQAARSMRWSVMAVVMGCSAVAVFLLHFMRHCSIIQKMTWAKGGFGHGPAPAGHH